ncbi:ornithine carbamoyltransferase [Candidatus Mycoplasma mahonii]|uniref:ornithine carbamoyltransferase n=1 Tax=Candidatus Mycoplasma mahonii TaxID=3004105 RepID=UPI0026ECEA3C|nr:ornithine carbamoyltransferase [Candidatus Mycoplasma mahonii]WKX02573.1 ornithine carbamoyltransferase [Candidatus Mycoplasma mahonii]
MQNMRGKNFIKILDLSNDEFKYLLKLSHNLKAQKYNGIVDKPLNGKSVALLFQKDSTRTRCSFEIGAADLGMHTVYIGPSGSQFGKKESIEDTAKVLGRMFDGIQFRGYAHKDVELLAQHSGVPVWNGLTDDWHPTQMIADFMTIQEYFGTDLKGKKIVYSGDGRNNMANSLMVSAAKLGMHFVMLSPKELMPAKGLVTKCEKIASETDGKIELSSDWKIATKGAHVIYTDVWVSMGESDWNGRLKSLHKYQVNMDMIKNAHEDVIFLHCLPAFHDTHTTVSYEKAKEYGNKYPNVKNGEFEVTNAVFRSKYSKVFEEAENRLHSIKAIMLATIGQ